MLSYSISSVTEWQDPSQLQPNKTSVSKVSLKITCKVIHCHLIPEHTSPTRLKPHADHPDYSLRWVGGNRGQLVVKLSICSQIVGFPAHFKDPAATGFTHFGYHVHRGLPFWLSTTVTWFHSASWLAVKKH